MLFRLMKTIDGGFRKVLLGISCTHFCIKINDASFRSAYSLLQRWSITISVRFSPYSSHLSPPTPLLFLCTFSFLFSVTKTSAFRAPNSFCRLPRRHRCCRARPQSWLTSHRRLTDRLRALRARCFLSASPRHPPPPRVWAVKRRVWALLPPRHSTTSSRLMMPPRPRACFPARTTATRHPSTTLPARTLYMRTRSEVWSNSALFKQWRVVLVRIPHTALLICAKSLQAPRCNYKLSDTSSPKPLGVDLDAFKPTKCLFAPLWIQEPLPSRLGGFENKGL